MVFCNYTLKKNKIGLLTCHNPYFNRWFSAICSISNNTVVVRVVTILILIDGFLQYKGLTVNSEKKWMSQSLF